MISSFYERYPQLSPLKIELNEAISLLENTFKQGHKLLVAGNGGSAADSEHVAGELLKGFMHKRRIDSNNYLPNKYLTEEEYKFLYNNLQHGLPVIPLTGFPSFASAFANDEDPKLIFAQLVEALGQVDDVLMLFSTSGNSANIVYAAAYAKMKNLKVLAITGQSGGKLKAIADITLAVNATSTPLIQELHLPLYHYICASLEDKFFA